MKYYKKLSSILLSIFSLSLLSGCTSSDNNQSIDNNEVDLKNQDSSTGNSIQAEDNIIKLEPIDNNTPQLKISSNCLGCGRCVNTDPAHFDFNNNTGKAMVASQDNLDTSNLKQAINNCPTSTISL
jgi:ferredoxin